ncbi:MAG: YbaK/EbsC family protein, partial [Planctomycetota bacterium]
RSNAIRRHFHSSKARFATREELLRLTGLVPGCVPPFGPPVLGLPLCADTDLLAGERIAFNPGCLTASIIMSAHDYRRLARPEVIPFAGGEADGLKARAPAR